MALVRCARHSRISRRMKHNYSAYTSAPSAVCGAKNCRESGFVWLSEDEGEVDRHQRGERIFGVHTGVLQLRVSEEFVRAEYGGNQIGGGN